MTDKSEPVISDLQIRAYRDDHRGASDLDVSRCCSAALGLPVEDGALGLLDQGICRARIVNRIRDSLKVSDWYSEGRIADRKRARPGMYLSPEEIDRARDEHPEEIDAQCAADAKELPRGPNEDPLTTRDVLYAQVKISSVICRPFKGCPVYSHSSDCDCNGSAGDR